MFDAKRLLGQFISGQVAKQLGGGGSGFGGSAGGFGAPGGGGGFGGGGLGGSAGGALAGGLASILLGSKKGRKMGGSAAKLGGMALIGSLAWRAYQNWQASGAGQARDGGSFAGGGGTGFGGFGAPPPQGFGGGFGSGGGSFSNAGGSPWAGFGGGAAAGGFGSGSAPAEPPAGSPFAPMGEAEQQEISRKLLRAMIAAAKADGHIDAAEQAAIFGEMDKLDLDPDDKAFVIDELRAPLDIDAVARSASGPEEAAEIYAASLLAIDVDNAAERGYLAMLAARLKLDDGLVRHLHETVEAAGRAA